MGDTSEQARRLLDAITPGPWRLDRACERVVARDSVGTIAVYVAGTISGADAEFIAAAPSLVADLLAEVDRLSAGAPVPPLPMKVDGYDPDSSSIPLAERYDIWLTSLRSALDWMHGLGGNGAAWPTKSEQVVAMCESASNTLRYLAADLGRDLPALVARAAVPPVPEPEESFFTLTSKCPHRWTGFAAECPECYPPPAPSPVPTSPERDRPPESMAPDERCRRLSFGNVCVLPEGHTGYPDDGHLYRPQPEFIDGRWVAPTSPETPT